MIGDAAMLVGPEPAPVLEAALTLVEAARGRGRGLPAAAGRGRLRAGAAAGGDWYGRPVNLASRITAIARPGSVLAAEGVHDALEDDYDWSFAGERRLKGIDGKVKLFRCRRPQAKRAPTTERGRRAVIGPLTGDVLVIGVE